MLSLDNIYIINYLEGDFLFLILFSTSINKAGKEPIVDINVILSIRYR